ncbi:MAG: carbonic anhydrase [Chlamydiales bacterium]
MPAKKGLERLIEGNKRFVNHESEHPNRNEERRRAIASKQKPFAAIVGCSDSRVPLEIIFDEGLGDIFAVRVAGNVVGQIELESIEFAAYILKSSIILVLGHEKCGAVNAVFEDNDEDIAAIAKLIKPAVENAGSSLEQAVKNNALNMRDYLRKSPKIAELIQDEKIEVEAGYYHLKSGQVELLK